MKKITKYLMLLIGIITLNGCGKTATIEESRTIILNVDSDVVPQFTSNFGEGTYDENTKKYTHTIDYIKDLYIFLSYDDLKTVKVHIPTSDMRDKIITKSVEFGDVLDAEVEVIVEGVKSLEGLEIDSSLLYSNLQIGNKNKFKFTLPSRDQNYNLKFTLPNYRTFDLDISKEDLVSGNAKINTIALTTDQISISFGGSGYQYTIYSSETNKIVASGSNYDMSSSVQNVILPNDESYYVKAMANNKPSKLYKVGLNESLFIDIDNNNAYSNGYLNINYGEVYYSTYLYNKDKGIISTNYSTIYGSIESYGLLIGRENRWYFLEDLASKVTKPDGREFLYTINLDDMEEVSFNVTRINLITKETMSSGIDNSVSLYYDTSTTFENNTFYVTIEEIIPGDLEIELYTKENVKLDEIYECYISSNFTGDIFSGTINHEGRTIPYTFPVFIEDLVYEDEKYTYPKQIVDTNVSLLSIKYLTDNGYFETLSRNNYLLDEEQEVIMGTDVGNNTYFELQVNKTYTFKISNKTYEFTVTEDDVESGTIFIMDDDTRKIQVKIPQGYYLQSNDFYGMKFYPNSDGIVSVPVGDKSECYAYISNGYANSSGINIIRNDGSIYEFRPFYVLEGGYIQNGDTYDGYSQMGSNGITYIDIRVYEGYTDFPSEFYTSISAIDLDGYSSNYKINISNFIYNEEIKAYYYNMDNHFDHVLIFDNQFSYYRVNWSGEHYTNFEWRPELGEYGDYIYKVYVNGDITIRSDNYDSSITSYTITSSDPKQLNVSLVDMEENGIYTIVVTAAN